jgi:hypothetical protein
VAFVFLVIPVFSAAQQNITCDANHENRKYCGSYGSRSGPLGSPDQRLSLRRGPNLGWIVKVFGSSGVAAPYSSSSPRGYDHDRDRDVGDRRGWWDPESDATWPPPGDWHGGRWKHVGACFYKERDFSGGFFCLRRGESRESLGEFRDKISSIRVFGDARVTVYDERDFRRASNSLDHARPDLHDWRVRQKPDHTWNDRISSIQVE